MHSICHGILQSLNYILYSICKYIAAIMKTYQIILNESYYLYYQLFYTNKYLNYTENNLFELNAYIYIYIKRVKLLIYLINLRCYNIFNSNLLQFLKIWQFCVYQYYVILYITRRPIM